MKERKYEVAYIVAGKLFKEIVYTTQPAGLVMIRFKHLYGANNFRSIIELK